MHGQIQAAGVAGMFYPAQADACANMVDSFLLIMLARAGDSLQGIKKGVLELADLVAHRSAVVVEHVDAHAGRDGVEPCRHDRQHRHIAEQPAGDLRAARVVDDRAAIPADVALVP